VFLNLSSQFSNHNNNNHNNNNRNNRNNSQHNKSRDLCKDRLGTFLGHSVGQHPLITRSTAHSSHRMFEIMEAGVQLCKCPEPQDVEPLTGKKSYSVYLHVVAGLFVLKT
jgi:hypothetical protein